MIRRTSILLCGTLPLFGCAVDLADARTNKAIPSSTEKTNNSRVTVSIDSQVPPPATGQSQVPPPSGSSAPVPAANQPENPSAGCILTGNTSAKGPFASMGSTNLAFTNTKQTCANRCRSMMSSLVSKASFLSETFGPGCSYSCKWNGADIVDRFESETSCKAGTADPF